MAQGLARSHGGWRRFISSYPFQLDTTTTQPHNLGVVPAHMVVEVVCKTAEIGYAIGDRVRMDFQASTGTARVWDIYADVTNVVLLIKATHNFTLLNKGTRVDSSITAANWKVEVTPYVN